MPAIQRNKDIQQGIVDIFTVNLGLEKGEAVLVLTDLPSPGDWRTRNSLEIQKMLETSLLAKQITEIAAEHFTDCNVRFRSYGSLGRSGAEPPVGIAKKMTRSDVVLAVTTYSITHTDARMRACGAGSRVATMPGVTPEMLGAKGVMSVDYKRMRREGRKVADLMAGAVEARIHCPAGTDLTLCVEGRTPVSSLGDLTRKGAWGNLPGGEVYVAPVEGTAAGQIVIGRERYTHLPRDMVLVFEKGLVTRVTGGGQPGDQYRSLLGMGRSGEPYVSRRNCAELGVGLNPNATNPFNLLEAEKIRGTVHIAVGDNVHFGGKTRADLHQDFVIFQPTLALDGELIIDAGRLCV